MSMDSLQPSQSGEKTSFYTHETNFLQGVGQCLGDVHHWIMVRENLLKVAQSALSWVHRRCPLISKTEVYVVQPTRKWEVLCREHREKEAESEGKNLYQLCLMLATTPMEPAAENINKVFLPRENQFLEYLFECVENSEPVSATVYGSRRLAYPIRDHTGCAVAVVDLATPSKQELTPHQLGEITKVLKLLTAAFYRLSSARRMARGEDGEGQGKDRKEEQSMVAGMV